MSTEGVPYRKKRHNLVLAPTTRMGKWAAGLVAAVFALAVSLVTIVPEDSLAAALVGLPLLLLLPLAGAALYAAIARRGDRALSVYAAAFLLVAGILFVLLHSLFISD